MATTNAQDCTCSCGKAARKLYAELVRTSVRPDVLDEWREFANVVSARMGYLFGMSEERITDDE